MIKILCVADHKDPVVYSNQIKQRFGDINFVLGAGDLPLDYYGFIVSMLNKPLYFVFGNHNLSRFGWFNKRYSGYMENSAHEHYQKSSFGSTYINEKIIRKSGVLIGGLGGSKRYNKGMNQYTEFQMFMKMVHMLPGLLYNKLRYGRFLDILLTHTPPRFLHDREDPCHQGFKTLLWFMKVFKPQYLIHGHIHLYNLNEIRESRYFDTIVINCYDHYLLEINKRDLE